MTASLTDRDQNTGAASERYDHTHIAEINGHTVRTRVGRGKHLNDSGAVAEVRTDTGWSRLAADALNNWWYNTPPPSPDVDAAAVLGPVAERLSRGAAEI